MEDTDQNDNDALGAELHQRAAKLEAIMRNFSVTADFGMVEGGFGKLKGWSNADERLSRIEQALSDFELNGQGGLVVSGNVTEGYVADFNE
jgi:hypothetical protein